MENRQTPTKRNKHHIIIIVPTQYGAVCRGPRCLLQLFQMHFGGEHLSRE